MVLAGLVAAQSSTNSYVGAGSCKFSNCHGGTTDLPEGQSRILGNEFATWWALDKHSRAYAALSNLRSKRMAEILKMGNATTDKRCTVCHVVGSPEKSPSDGVACEACHGPASNWLGSHLQVKSNSPEDLAATHTDSVRKGMTDTKKLDVRAKMCLACHLGHGVQQVDHEMIAAGHPDLPFELDTFTVGQPAHHRAPKPATGNTLPMVRAWAVGQSVALAEAMRLLAAHAVKNWPEFSDLECYQCHHDLLLDSWRIQRGYGNHKPGSLQVNLARFDVMRILVAQAASQLPAFDNDMRRLSNIVSEKFTNGAAVAQAAASIEQTADMLTSKFLVQNFDVAATEAMIEALVADIQRIAGDGVNSAEQATLSLDALTAAISPKNDAKRTGISALYDYLEHPSAYKPDDFVALFRRAAVPK
jgi:hypothetical protein